MGKKLQPKNVHNSEFMCLCSYRKNSESKHPIKSAALGSTISYERIAPAHLSKHSCTDKKKQENERIFFVQGWLLTSQVIIVKCCLDSDGCILNMRLLNIPATNTIRYRDAKNHVVDHFEHYSKKIRTIYNKLKLSEILLNKSILNSIGYQWPIR